MSENDNGQVVGILMSIRQDLGELKATVKGFESVPGRLLTLELAAANQRGAARVWHMISAGIGGVVGAVATYLGHGAHS